MSLSTILLILGAVAAFAYGIWSGLGKWGQSQDEIDRAISERGRRRKATRHFTPLDLMARMTGVPTQRDRRNPFRFGEEEGLRDPGEDGEDDVDTRRMPRPPSAAQERVDEDEGAADDGSQHVTEPDDHP